MRFLSFQDERGRERTGLLVNGQTLDLEESAGRLGLSIPADMAGLLERWPESLEIAREVQRAHLSGQAGAAVQRESARPLAPVPHPGSLRDAYAFRAHVLAGRRSRGLEMVPEFDVAPVFYFGNHRSVVGEGPVAVEEDQLCQLDFELEAALVLGRGGKNIDARSARDHVAGLMVMNDFSARALQAEEMTLNLGPAKGKDFATALGPWLVTLDELADRCVDAGRGDLFDLRMRAFHNARLVSEGNLRDMSWTFGEILERASYGATLYPGDVIGSGAVGTGCFLELNGTWALGARAMGQPEMPVWLQPGDVISLEIERLGMLTNTIVRAPGGRRILRRPTSPSCPPLR